MSTATRSWRAKAAREPFRGERAAGGAGEQQAREQGREVAERRLDAAIGADALRHAEARIAFDQAGEGVGGEAVDIAARVARDLEHVLEAGVGQQRAAGEIAFEHGVRRDGGASQQQPDIGEREAEACRCLPHASQQSFGGIGGRRRRLPRGDAARPRIEDPQVGEGAVDIDGDAHGPLRAHRLSILAGLRRAGGGSVPPASPAVTGGAAGRCRRRRGRIGRRRSPSPSRHP
jgi:hypothetical protein